MTLTILNKIEIAKTYKVIVLVASNKCTLRKRIMLLYCKSYSL